MRGRVDRLWVSGRKRSRKGNALLKTSPPSLGFVLCAILAVIFGVSLYDGYRKRAISYRKAYPKVLRHRGAIPDIKWPIKTVTYRRTAEPFKYWLGMAMTSFGFVVFTLGAALMLFLTIVNW